MYEQAWEEALQISPIRSEATRKARWDEYWNYMSGYYRREPDLEGDDIFRYFSKDRIVREGDTVLDIGCGHGTYSLPIATIARKVTCIDRSPAMIKGLTSIAASAGILNINAVHGLWEEYQPEEKYDLVLSAFCPAVSDPGSMLRMERLSRRACCYVAGDKSQFRLLGELWQLVFGRGYHTGAYDINYPYQFLRSLGREPSLQYFKREPDGYAGSEEVVREFVAYFSCLTDISPAIENQIRKYIMARSKNGTFIDDSPSIAWALQWEVPGTL